ncbi:prepilin-type N-terminal cleavage/methylation domain-containing protein [Candidatus Saccharibacteria bacterium]|nr:prepilin-type N-terminal cleavage/methylation domain-containing protein [Candidatus Saccharibacteria bacterium]
MQSFRSDASLQSQAGLTLIELLVAIVLIGIISTTFLIFFKSSLFNYLDLQKDATSFTQLSSQAARVSGVLRGTTGIVTASGNELSVYAYFDPSDTYVSLLHYYVVNNGGAKQLKADLTPMTANPPIGTPITASQRTFVIIDSLYQPSGQNLFAYLNATGGTLSLPITDLQTIKGIRVNLAAQTVAAGGGNQSLAVEVSLRNRKTNL